MSFLRLTFFVPAIFLVFTNTTLCLAADKESKQEVNTEKLASQVIRDLRYGETLFNFYQKKYFSAITNLMVAKVRAPITVQGDSPALLLGGLYLAYGMHSEASLLFDQLLNSDTLPTTHDQAWYYIAKLRYINHSFVTAEQALLKIKNTLPEDREAERLHLLANTYMAQNKYDQAVVVLQDFSGNSDWEAYANFNLGVALVKSGKIDDGIELLKQVGDLNPDKIGHELRALRDKANLALGFAYLRGNNPVAAVERFEKIRLTGPLSNKALLGIGWAYTTLEEYQQALTPWIELQNRKSLDTSVQESLIAIPFTVEKLGKKRLAMEQYQVAIDAYKTEIDKLEQVMIAVRNGELIEAMQPANLDDETSLPLHTFGLPNSITAPYIHELMATNVYQEAYRNYQNLLHLRYILSNWLTQLPAYELMLSERRKAYFEKLPVVASDERLNQLNAMYTKREKYAKEVQRIENEYDVFALITEDEEELLEVLIDVKKKIERLSASQDMSEELEKYEFLYGILLYELNEKFPERLWQVKHSLIELDRGLAITRKSKRNLVKAANEAPRYFEGYAQKIEFSRQRIGNMLNRLDAIIIQQERYITNLALYALTQRRQQLENYHVRARFGIARLYDSLIIEKEKQAQEAGSEAE